MVDSSAFWSAILQVVPVLFIAVMIEFRYLLGRVTQDEEDFAALRAVRVALGLTLLGISVLLAITFANALRGLVRQIPLDDPSATLATIALSAAAGVAIGPPGAYLGYTATQDIWLSLHRRMPWSKVRRLMREVKGLLREGEDERRLEREARLKLLLDTSRLYVRAAQAEREGDPRTEEMYITADMCFRLAVESKERAKPGPPELPDPTALTLAEREYFRTRLADEVSRSSS